jgi:hypothetical protein
MGTGPDLPIFGGEMEFHALRLDSSAKSNKMGLTF